MKANAKMKAEPKADAAAAPKSSKKMLIMIIGLVVLLAGAAGAYFMLKGGGEGADHKPAKKAKAHTPPVFVPLDAFTVNLQPENGDQYLQIAFTLQVSDEKQVELIKANMARVRSRVLLLLSSKKASEISTPEGKAALSKELVTTLQAPFVEKGDPQEISDVLYTAFIIQ